MLNQRYFPKYKAPHRIDLKRTTKPRVLSALLFTLAVSSALTCFLLQENPVSVEFRSDMPTVVSRIDTEPVRRKLGCFPFVPIGNIGETNSVVSNRFSSTDFSYSGTYSYLDDGDGNCRIRFLTSGIFTPIKNFTFDLFLVGGGAGGGAAGTGGRGGGGGGRTLTHLSIELQANTAYTVTVGAGGASNANGGTTSAFGYSISGGNTAGNSCVGGAGGSGGGAGARDDYEQNGKAGGSNGSNGVSASNDAGGAGQGATTREFSEVTGDLYGGGGGGGAYYQNTRTGGAGGAGGGGAGGNSSQNGYNGTANTGGGGGGSGHTTKVGGTGGSGIVILRNHRAA
ncbi:MAG: glycine-rich domain-containing protein [Clostridiaceae bacterium]